MHKSVIHFVNMQKWCIPARSPWGRFLQLVCRAVGPGAPVSASGSSYVYKWDRPTVETFYLAILCSTLTPSSMHLGNTTKTKKKSVKQRSLIHCSTMQQKFYLSIFKYTVMTGKCLVDSLTWEEFCNLSIIIMSSCNFDTVSESLGCYLKNKNCMQTCRLHLKIFLIRKIAYRWKENKSYGNIDWILLNAWA